MGIIDNFKDILKLADSVNNLELYKKLAELQNSVVALQDENRSLKDQLRKAEEDRSIGSRLHVTDNAYYLDDGKLLDGPFCMRCWDVDKLLVREKSGATHGTHFCPECLMRRR